MRKIVIVAGLLMGAALFTGTPAKADLGCLCGKLGAPAVCVATVTECNFSRGGVCLSACTMEMKKAKKHGHKGPRTKGLKENVSRPFRFLDKAPSRDGAFVLGRGLTPTQKKNVR